MLTNLVSTSAGGAVGGTIGTAIGGPFGTVIGGLAGGQVGGLISNVMGGLGNVFSGMFGGDSSNETIFQYFTHTGQRIAFNIKAMAEWMRDLGTNKGIVKMPSNAYGTNLSEAEKQAIFSNLPAFKLALDRKYGGTGTTKPDISGYIDMPAAPISILPGMPNSTGAGQYDIQGGTNTISSIQKDLGFGTGSIGGIPIWLVGAVALIFLIKK